MTSKRPRDTHSSPAPKRSDKRSTPPEHRASPAVRSHFPLPRGASMDTPDGNVIDLVSNNEVAGVGGEDEDKKEEEDDDDDEGGGGAAAA